MQRAIVEKVAYDLHGNDGAPMIERTFSTMRTALIDQAEDGKESQHFAAACRENKMLPIPSKVRGCCLSCCLLCVDAV